MYIMAHQQDTPIIDAFFGENNDSVIRVEFEPGNWRGRVISFCLE